MMALLSGMCMEIKIEKLGGEGGTRKNEVKSDKAEIGIGKRPWKKLVSCLGENL